MESNRMTEPKQKIVQYLTEAQGMEDGLVRVLQAQIAMTPSGSYRSALETHLRETRDHSRRLKVRLKDLGSGESAVQAVAGAASSVAGQALALAKAPLDLVRGLSGEEKVLKNAKDAAATETLEIATYIALERLARGLGDDVTADLAVSIRADEEKTLDRILKEIPKLTDALVRAEVKGEDVADISETGAAEIAREVTEEAKEAVQKTASSAKRVTRQARKVPGVEEGEGAVKGAVASADELPIANYDDLTAEDIVEKLPQLSQVDLAKIEAYERKKAARTTILDRIDSLRGDAPWPGYDDMKAEEIVKQLRDTDDETAKRVRDYEHGHKARKGVIEAAERELSHA
jgi:ferritin-like metal-binding protein YciE